MSPDERSDTATLSDLVAACLRVTDYVQGASRSDLDRDDRLLSARCYQIAVIGEAVKRVSPTTRGKHPEVPWKDIAGMRDRLIHGYDFTSVDAVMAFYREQLAALEQRNYDHAEITNTRITPLTPDSAIMNKSIRRYKKDGSVLEEGAAIYPACKSSGAWKLCGMMRQESQYFGKVY